MITNKESDSNIQMVVNDFKAKYGVATNIPTSGFIPDPLMVFDWNKFLLNFILINILILFSFELFRRLFYYVFFGSLRPLKYNK